MPQGIVCEREDKKGKGEGEGERGEREDKEDKNVLNFYFEAICRVEDLGVLEPYCYTKVKYFISMLYEKI